MTVKLEDKKLNKVFNEFVAQSKKRLSDKEKKEDFSGWDNESEIPTPVLSGRAYDKLRTIMLFPTTVDEKEFFDVANLVIIAWHRKKHPRKVKR